MTMHSITFLIKRPQELKKNQCAHFMCTTKTFEKVFQQSKKKDLHKDLSLQIKLDKLQQNQYDQSHQLGVGLLITMSKN